MPATRVLLYREGSRVPFRDWFEALPLKPRLACLSMVGRLRAMGHELRRPFAAPLAGGIHELRFKVEGVNYRVLYFFHGQAVVVLSHGITKQCASVPRVEIRRAAERKTRFQARPEAHLLWVEDHHDAP